MESSKMVKLFTPEYKKQCVDMVLEGKHSVTQVCKMMRVSQSALNHWRSILRKILQMNNVQ